MFTVVCNDKAIQPRYKIYYIYLLSAPKSTWNVLPIHIFPPLFSLLRAVWNRKLQLERSSVIHLQVIDIWFILKPDVNVDATHQKDSCAMDNKSPQLSKLNKSISTGSKLLSKHSCYSVWLPVLVLNKGRTVFTLLYLCFLSVFWNKSCSSTWVLFSVGKVIWGVWQNESVHFFNKEKGKEVGYREEGNESLLHLHFQIYESLREVIRKSIISWRVTV